MNYNRSRAEYNFDLQEFVVGAYVFDVWSLYAHLEQVTDKRDRRGVRYPLADALTLIILARLGGEDTLSGVADWLQHRAEGLVHMLGLTRAGMPHRVTISRILGYAVTAEELEELLRQHFGQHARASQALVVAIDGKVLRGTIELGRSQGVRLLAAYLPEVGLVLMQVEVESRENEIVVAPRLVSVLDVRGKVVIGDAMHTQRAFSIQIVSAGGDYLWTAKGNQAEVQDTIARLFEPEPVTPGFAAMATDFQTATVVDKGHGRLERRTLTSSAMLRDYLDWPYVEQVFKLERQSVDLKTGETTRQVRYGLTSLAASQASPAQLLHLLRTYWGIENGLHYRRDVTLREDRCRLKMGGAARMMATLNNLVLNMIVRAGHTNVAAARRRYAAHPLEALQLIMQRP